MTDKEKIRVEVERVKEIHESNLDKPMERGRIGHAHGYVDCCDEILDFIDSLPEEKPNVWDRVDINKAIKARLKKTGETIEGFYDGKGHFDHFIDHDVFDRYSIDDVEIPYDEAYLNECIAKASKTWEGVDVDKYMDEVRGRCPKESDDLEKAAIDFADTARKKLFTKVRAISSIADYDYGCIDGFIAGAEWQKEQMMDGWLKDRDGCFWDGVEEGKNAMEKQMMEEAVEGEIVKDIHNLLHVHSGRCRCRRSISSGTKCG